MTGQFTDKAVNPSAYLLIYGETLVDMREVAVVKSSETSVTFLFKNGERLVFQDWENELFNEIIGMIRHSEAKTSPEKWQVTEKEESEETDGEE